jgi:hypothetical protein
MSFSLALRLHCGGYAASHANREKEIPEYANRFCRASHDGGVDAGLRRRRRRLCSAPAATSSFHRGNGHAKERVGAARKYGDIFRNGNKHDGYECDLEREWRGRRKCGHRHDHARRRVYRAYGLAFARECTGYSDEPCGRDEIGYGSGDVHKRYFTFCDAQPSKCRARRSSRISRDGGQQRASGHGSAVERIGRGVRNRLRSRGYKRELHGAADSSIAAERNVDSAKRGRSFEAGFVDCGGYQHIFAATLRAIECAGGRVGNDSSNTDSGSRVGAERSAGVVLERRGLQRSRLRNVERGDDAIGRRKQHAGGGNVHRAGFDSKSKQRDGGGISAGGPFEEGASHGSDPGGSQRKRFALDGDARSESSRHADGTGEWINKSQCQLERERGRGRQHKRRRDLRCGLESLPVRDERRGIASGFRRSWKHSFAESGERDGGERRGFHKKRQRANHGDQSRRGLRDAGKRDVGAAGRAGICGGGAREQRSERGVAGAGGALLERGNLRID